MIAALTRSLCTCLFFLLVISLHARIDQDRPIRQYFTQKMNARVNMSEADYSKSQSKIERDLVDQQPFHKLEKIVVPVVFHILYQAGKPAPQPNRYGGNQQCSTSILPPSTSRSNIRPTH